MASFLAGSTEVGALSSGSYETEPTTTYLLARDEDCENSFHSTADFMNMFLVDSALGIDPKQQKVLYTSSETTFHTPFDTPLTHPLSYAPSHRSSYTPSMFTPYSVYHQRSFYLINIWTDPI